MVKIWYKTGQGISNSEVMLLEMFSMNFTKKNSWETIVFLLLILIEAIKSYFDIIYQAQK